MPFIQRIVEPVYVSKGEVDKAIQNELECVTNSSLANIIRQLSSLSQHAEDMFKDLNRETMLFFQRANELNSRVEHLTTQVTQLNPTEEEVSLHDINLRKPYQSSKPHDQQVVSRITIPKAIQDLYNKCDKPPALEKLNSYREDGKDCMKFYTDPGYFFELWYADIKKDIDNKRKELKQKRDKKGRTHRSGKPKDFTPKEIRTKAQKYADKAQGIELSNDYRTPNIQVGGQRPIPAGYTKHPGHAPAPSDPQRQGQNGYPAQQQMPTEAQNHVQNSPVSNGPVNVHSHYQQGSPQQQQQHMQQQKHQRQSQKGHPAQSPNNYSPGNRQSQRPSIGSNVYGSTSRMAVAPPPPPPAESGGFNQRGDRGSLSPQRTSLPPPPPPPPLDDHDTGSPQHQTSPHHQGINQGYQQHQGYHQDYPSQPSVDSSPDDHGLPPPPPPPLTDDSMGDMGSPAAPSPPPILHHTAPAPPPPPPPPPAPVMKPPDTISVSSETSTQSSLASAHIEPAPAPKQTARSALLEEIRLGNRSLRKTEERKREAAPRDRFDVHAVMTKAFDMRRKALEDSESENDEKDEDEWE